jgi:sugar transferase (PEP-CTERM system associated)
MQGKQQHKAEARMEHKEPETGSPDKRNFERSSKASVRFFGHSTYFLRHHIPTEFILLGVIEFIVLAVSFYIGIELRHDGMVWHERLAPFFPRALVFCGVMQLSMIAFGVYQRQAAQSPSLLAVRIGGSMFVGMIVLGVVFYTAPTVLIARGALILSVFVSFVFVMAVRLAFFRISNAYDMRLRILVLGAGKNANLIREVEAGDEINGINIVSYFPMPGDEAEDKGITLAQTRGALTKFVHDNAIDVIVLAMDDRRSGLPVHELLDCKMDGVEVIDLLTFFERHTSRIRLDIMQPSWLFLSDGFQVSNFRRMWKRIFDISVVLVMVPIVLPVVLLAGMAILLECRCRESAFYTQTRVGEGGRLFQIYKFRSMVSDAEQDGVARWAKKNDARITRVGAFLRKFRLDELPQLFNVLKGDMSFVGPRPERPEFVEHLAQDLPYYNERHRVKPGLSGWAQIRYPYGASVEDGQEKLQYDLYYVKNYSILLDALILLQTAEVVLLGRGSH